MLQNNKFIYELIPIDFWDGWIPFSVAIINPTKFGIMEYDADSGIQENDIIKQGQKNLVTV